MPCAWIMYQKCCQYECRETRRCKCASSDTCETTCDPQCGTTFNTMVSLIPQMSWPSVNLQHRYVAKHVHSIDPGQPAQMISCLARGVPVVVNLYLFRNQVAFFENSGLLVSGRSVGKRAPAKHHKNHEAMLA